jgi:MoxR-like ATPase
VNGADLVAFQRLVRRVPVAEPVMRYALQHRPHQPSEVADRRPSGEEVRGVRRQRPRRAVPGARRQGARADQRRYHVSFEDIRALAHPVLRHRVLTNFRAESEGLTSDSIIDELLTACRCRSRDVDDRNERGGERRGKIGFFCV